MVNSLNPVELINKDTFSSEWEVIDPAGITSNWSFTPNGALKQTVSVGSAKTGSGTLAILKNPVSSDCAEVRLHCFPGASYQVGMVICYADRKNYVIFSIEQFGAAYKGYYILVAESKNGVCSNLMKEERSNELTGPLLFAARQEGKDVVLYFGTEAVLTLPGKLLKNQRFGLYSQRNTDAIFEEFTMNSVLSTSDPVLSAPSPTPPAASFAPAPAPVPTAENSIVPFLKIKEPNTLSLIEFKEPFRVSLDSLYSSLYLNSELSRPKEKQYSNKPTRSLLLDIRPKRWYREYKNIKDALRLAQFDLSRATAVLETLENNGAYPQDVDIEKHDAAIRDARKKYLIFQDVMERLVQERNNPLQEMRIAGYVLRKENVPEEMAELGYDFYIAGGVAGYKDYDPIDVDPFLDIGDDVKWADLETSLRERLFANPRFSASSKERYLSNLDSLKAYDQYLPHIQKDLDALVSEIVVLQNTISQQESQIESVKQEIKNWKADRKVLEDSHINFRPYSDGEYPIGGGGAGPENNAKFRNWFSEQALVFKSFNYKFTVNGGNYSVAIDKYKGFEWYQDYQIDVKAIYIDVYHPYPWPVWPWQAPGWTESVKQSDEYRYPTKGDPEIRNFFDKALRVCDAFIDQYLPQEMESLQTKIATLKNNKIGVELRKKDIESNALRLAREAFVDDWNRASIMDTTAVGEKIASPNSDPLTDLIADIVNDGESAKVYTVEFRSDGYYTQDGQSLLDFIDVAEKLPHLPILLLPVFDRYGRKLAGVWNAVVNPVRSSNVIKLPTITFVETYKTEVRWKGYCIGELTQTVNLFPGEKKELVIEHSTRLSEKLSQTEASETSRSTTVTTSFEQQLQQELSEKNETALEESVTDENERKQDVSRVITDEVGKVDSLSLKFTGGQASASATSHEYTKEDKDESYKGTKKKDKSKKADLGLEASSTTTVGHTDEKTDALTISQRQTAEKSNKESKETLKKAVSNVINKSASETSENNKVSFTSTKSTEFEETTSNKETVVLENPNVGRTINYNFFQVQNMFETRTTLIDVKIVLDPGIEIVKYSDLTDLRVFDLEEFSRIYYNSDAKDPRIALLSAIVARQVFKTYCSLGGKPGIADVIRFTDIVPMDEDMYNILNLSFPWETGGSLEENLIDPIRKALSYLKAISLKFNEVELIPPAVHTVNSGSYYMDAEVGLQPATEQYLEDRRDIQTDKQRAEVEEMRARIKAGVFHQPLPAGLTTLQVNNGEKPVELTSSVQPKPEG